MTSGRQKWHGICHPCHIGSTSLWSWWRYCRCVVPGCALGTLRDADDDADNSRHVEQVERQKAEISHLTHQVNEWMNEW